LIDLSLMTLTDCKSYSCYQLLYKSQMLWNNIP